MSADLAARLWRMLVHCPPASLLWASIGYRAGVIDGREQLRADLAADLAQAGRAWRTSADLGIGRPSHAELQRRRGEPADQMRRNLDRPLPGRKP